MTTTPYLASEAGMALGTLAKKNKKNAGAPPKIGIASDSCGKCRLLHESASAGLRYTGAEIYDLGSQCIPAVRGAVDYLSADYMMYIGMYGDEPTVYFYDCDGLTPDADALKSLEKIFSKKEFAVAEEIAPVIRSDSVGDIYVKSLVDGLSGKEFKYNLKIRTSSQTVSEVLEKILREIEALMKAPADKYEFGADIGGGGQIVSFYKPDGENGKLVSNGRIFELKEQIVCEDEFYALISYCLIKERGVENIVLPYTVSENTENYILGSGVNVIRSQERRREALLRDILKKGGKEQFRLCSDGIYSSIKILDFLNSQDIGFSELLDKLPRAFRDAESVERRFGSGDDVVKKLKEKYQTYEEIGSETRPGGEKINRFGLGLPKKNLIGGGLFGLGEEAERGGIKIRSDGGIVLVIPSGKSSIKIITESYDAEAAHELAANIKNEILSL